MMMEMMVKKERNRIHRMRKQIAVLMDLVNLKSLMSLMSLNLSSSLNLKSLKSWKSLTHNDNSDRTLQVPCLFQFFVRLAKVPSS